MKIPPKLKIGDENWEVFLTLPMRGQPVGYCLKQDNVMLIDATADKHEMSITFLHEILHAIWPDNQVGASKEEFMVDYLSKELYAVLRKNKLLR